MHIYNFCVSTSVSIYSVCTDVGTYVGTAVIFVTSSATRKSHPALPGLNPYDRPCWVVILHVGAELWGSGPGVQNGL